MLKQADVIGHAIAALCDRREDVQNAAVHLARIGLTANIKAAVKAEFGGDHPVHLIDFLCIPVKQLHKAGFCAGCTAAAKEGDGSENEVELFQIGNEVLHPQTGAFSDGDQLRGQSLPDWQ